MVLAPGSRLGREDIRAFAFERLADFKVPRAVYFLEEFPTAELGKISKKDLRELANSYVGNENAG